MSDGFVALDDPALWQRWRTSRAGAARPSPGAGVPSTVGDLEQVHELAQAEGRAEGLAEGRAAAAAQAARLAALVTALEQALAEDEETLAEGVLALSLELARRMLQEALPVKRELMLPVVREALRAVPGGAAPAQLVLNPADVELVRAHFGEELRLGNCRIAEDHRIQPGGCRLISPQGEVDATLATRWKRLLAPLGRNDGWLDT